MNQEVLIPKMKRIDKSKKQMSLPYVSIFLVLFCTLLIICSTFINVEIKHFIIPSNLFIGNALTKEDFTYSFTLIPQIPVIMFICAILGRKLTLTSILIYIIAGLAGLPFFALGGGIKYFFEYGFGYILGYIPAVIISGNFLNKNYSFLNIIIATLLGVITIHIAGILYMTILALIKQTGYNFITGWISAQSGLKIIYDIITSFILMLIGKYIHLGIKFAVK